ncbi:MAG: hypothetical protein BEN19_08480 [Epulopiscium sp. Nuni2H_MBin003]|nr:MAG: hypothetical protein BEN19_08480 [Epulopiscium sp. Nuni2H_MBin003]
MENKREHIIRDKANKYNLPSPEKPIVREKLGNSEQKQPTRRKKSGVKSRFPILEVINRPIKPKYRYKMQLKRTFILASGYIFIMLLLIGKMTYLYMHKSEQYELIVLEMMGAQDVTINPLRGNIVDRNNKTIATSQITYHIILDPKILLNDVSVEQQNRTVEELANYIGITTQEIWDVINNNPNSSYRIMQKDIVTADKDMLAKLSLQGVWYEPSFIRTYPKGDFAASLIGFYNNQTGQYGIEQFYNDYLEGQDGRIYTTLQSGEIFMKETLPAVNGDTIVLTVDEVIQQQVERAMKEYVEQADPEGAAAIVMNPNTGEIYAMYSYPTFNPTTYGNLSSQVGQDVWSEMTAEEQSAQLNTAWKNYSIHNLYEPGSTFKPLMVAAAIDTGYLDVDTFTANCPGYINVAGETIKCWHTSGHGIQNVKQILANSCNPGVIAIAQLVPNDVFHSYMLQYGLLEKTGIDLTGESVGIIHSLSELGPVEKATSSMGQTFMLNAMQLLTAFSSVINGGYLLEPYVVSHIVDQNDAIIYKATPSLKRQVISTETSTLLAEYMRSVVVEGTGGFANISGYSIGGKTGTAEKGYPRAEGVEILSFIGYAPVKNPEVIAMILLDEGDEVVGGTAKVFSDIMKDVLPYLGISPDGVVETENDNLIEVPNFIGTDIYEAINQIHVKEFEYIIQGGGNVIIDQYPNANTKLPKASNITLYLETDSPENLIYVPNLVGLTVEQANAKLNATLQIEATGDGQIVTQIPKEGTQIDKGSKIIVQTMQ